MKKIRIHTYIIFFAALMLALPSVLWAAGSCTQTAVRDATSTSFKITLVCTGDSANGTIPTQTIDAANMAIIKDIYYLYTVVAYPTPAGTAPDAADVAVLMNGLDLLGGKGVNLIHATATQDTFPYSTFMSSYRYPLITNTLTVTVANQGTNSANYTIELVFVR